MNEVVSRVGRPIEWVTSNPDAEIVVTLGQAGGHATGTLEVVKRSAEPTRREFVASSCSEIAAALALVTALTLDPNARTEPLAVSASEPAVASTAPSKLQAPPPAARVIPPSAPAMPLGSAPARPAASRRKPAARYVAWLGPAIGVGFDYAPEPLVTWGVSLGARAARRAGFSPSFQLTPMWGKTGSTGPGVAEATFAWAMARLEACPTELRLVPVVSLEACGAAEVGRATARGAAAAVEPVAADRWWAAAGANLALHLSFGHFFSRLEVQALFPVTRDQFVFHEPERRVHQAGVLVYGTSLGLGFELGR
jgi:hypothetical protein